MADFPGDETSEALIGGAEDDFLEGLGGDDTLRGGAGSDTLDGGEGNDVLIGDIGPGVAEDWFEASVGDDTYYGGEIGQDDDPLLGDWNDITYWNRGFTSIIVEFSTTSRSGTVEKNGDNGSIVGIDTFYSIDSVHGTNAADQFFGGSGEGVQRFAGYGGDDLFDGTFGVNEVDYRWDAPADLKTGLVIDLESGAVIDATGSTDTLIAIERVRGTHNDDKIIGNAFDNRLRGEGGNDTISGGAGSDTFDGGAGDDLLIGGAGGGVAEDWFQASLGNDTIYGGEVDQSDDPALNFNEINYWSRGFDSIVVEFGSTSRSGTVEKSDSSVDTFHAIEAIHGTDGADTFIGGSGSGNQRFQGYGGDDFFDGTLGQNEVDYRLEARLLGATHGVVVDLGRETATDSTGGTDTLVAIERVRGTGLSDLIVGNELNNRIRGDAGDDTLDGAAGSDVIDGGTGIDTVTYASASGGIQVTLSSATTVAVQNGLGDNDTLLNIERVHGSAHNDTIGGSVGSQDVFVGLQGNDIFTGNGGDNGAHDVVDYSFDVLYGATYGVRINQWAEGARGDLAADTARDSFGYTDSILGVRDVIATMFADEIWGGLHNNRISAGAGNDFAFGFDGDDTLLGGDGDDTLEGGAGSDVIRGGSGNDTAKFSGSKGSYNFAVGADGALTVSGTEIDRVYDTESFSFADGTFTLSQLLSVPQDQPPPVVTPPVTVETTASTTLPEGSRNLVAGGSSNISLTGNALDNSITGNKGKNTINGGAGADKVNGGLGNDNLIGGSGKDAFLFTSKLGTSATDRKVNFDTLTDFSVKDDRIQLDNAIFKKLGMKGSVQKPVKLDKKFFTVGDKAKDKDDYIVYNKKTGVLSYDADGSGKEQAIEFALLKNKPTLKVDYFFVF